MARRAWPWRRRIAKPHFHPDMITAAEDHLGFGPSSPKGPDGAFDLNLACLRLSKTPYPIFPWRNRKLLGPYLEAEGDLVHILIRNLQTAWKEDLSPQERLALVGFFSEFIKLLGVTAFVLARPVEVPPSDRRIVDPFVAPPVLVSYRNPEPQTSGSR